MAIATAGIITCSQLGTTGAILALVSHGITSPAMFLLANSIYEVTHSRRLVLCKGVLSVFPPGIAFFFTISAASLCTPPLTRLLGEVWLFIRVVSLSKVTMLIMFGVSMSVVAYTLVLLTTLSHGRVNRLLSPLSMLMPASYLMLTVQILPLILVVFNMAIIY